MELLNLIILYWKDNEKRYRTFYKFSITRISIGR